MKKITKAIDPTQKWLALEALARKAAEDAQRYRRQPAMLRALSQRIQGELELAFDGDRNTAKAVVTHMSDASVSCSQCGEMVKQSLAFEGLCGLCRTQKRESESYDDSVLRKQ